MYKRPTMMRKVAAVSMSVLLTFSTAPTQGWAAMAQSLTGAQQEQGVTAAAEGGAYENAADSQEPQAATAAAQDQAATAAAQDQAATAAAPAATGAAPAKTAGSGDKDSAATDDGAKARDPRDITAEKNLVKVVFDGLKPGKVADAKEGEPALTAAGVMRFHVNLTPTDDDAAIAGDTVKVKLPAELAAFGPLSDSQVIPALETTSRNDDGTPVTGAAVGEWKLDGDTLTLKLGDLAKASKDAQSGKLTVDVAVPMTLKKDALGAEPADAKWTMLTQDGKDVEATLTLPAESEVADFATKPADDAAKKNDAADDTQAAQDQPEQKADGESASDSPEAPDFNLLDGETPVLLSNKLPLANLLSDEPTTTVTYKLSENSATASYKLFFDDNASANRPSAAEIETGLTLHFSVDGVTYDFTWENARDQLHMTEAEYEAVKIQANDEISSEYSFAAANLPKTLTTTTTTTTTKLVDKKDEEGNVILDPEGNPVQEEVPDVQVEESSVQIDWSMSFDPSQWTNTGDKGGSDYSGDWSNNYILADTVGGDGKTYDVLALTHVYHLKVDIEAAGYEYTDAELVEMLKQTYAAKTNVTLGPVGGTPVFEGTLLDFLNSADTVGYDDPSAIKWTVVNDELVIYNMISYDLKTGRSLDFVLRYDEQAPEGVGDYIKAVYDNSSAANHGGDSDAAYEGGTLRLLRAGNITFEATKTWVDTPEDAERTTETYALYRYRKGQGFSTASPVKVGNSYATVTVAPPAEGDSTTITFVDGEGKPILLPKYDPEGYEYCYGVRTKGTDDGYQTIYGSLDAEGNPSSDVNVTPNHDKADRDGHDALVYNGATVTERRSGTTNVDATKTWRAAAFQNQLSNVTCTFELQSSPDGTTWSAAKDADGNAITRDLSGFSEEQMSKKFSDGEKNVSFPEFDKLGRPLKYRWVEKAVKQGDKVTELPANAERNEFSLTLKDPATGADTTVEFVSTVDPQTGDITNAYVNHTTLQIRKYWYDGTKDGQASYTQSPTAGENGWSATEKFVASFTVYQDGKKVCVVTTNGTPGTVTDLSDKLGDGASVEETSPYTLTLRNVPVYSDQGQRHSYLILENATSAADRRTLTDEVEIDGQKKTAAVTEFRNNPTGGEWSEVNVSKRWVTGGDSHGNASVKIELVAKHDLVYKSEGNGHRVGDVYKQEGDVVATVDLSAKKEWFDSVGLPVGDVTLADLSAREVSVTINGTTYDVVSGRDDILAALRRNDPNATEGDLAAFPDDQAVIVDDHVFSVSNARVNGTLNSLEVSNTRVGWASVEATKTWVDEGADKNQRPDARLELKVAEGSAIIGTDADGNMTVTCGDMTYPVMAEVNGELVRCTAETLKIGKADDTQSFSIRYLPKYDQHGNNITYSLTEVMPDKGDYQCTAVWKGREVSAHHYYSDDTYDFTNQRSAQTSIQFFKKWRDAYVYEQGLRPDIYMTLYKRDSDGFGKVNGYIDCQWSLETNDDNKGVITTNNGDYYQGATITNLPKYDSKGALIQYFASERMSVDGSKLDYAPVYYSGSEVNANPEVVSTIDGSTLTGDDATGANTAVAAGGTLDNDITSTQAVKGEKAWSAVPTGFLSKDLPDVQIKIRRNNPSAPAGTEDTLVAVVTISAKDYSGNSWTYQVGAMTNEAGEYVDAQGAVVDSADKAAKLPMYDEYGRKYTYHVQESLIEYQDGAPVTSDKNYDPTVDEAAAAAGKVEGIVFTRTWDPNGKGFRIENSYNGNPVSAIDVTKVYDGRADNDSYPAKLTFKLYRTYYSHDRATYVTPQLVATQTMTADEFKAAGTTGTTSLTKTFQGLPTYSPDGFLWEYYVTESGTEAYTQSGKILNTGDAAANGVPAYVPDASAYVGQGTGAVIGVITLNTADGKNGAVEFDNDYTTNDLTLTGAKVWDDNNDAAGMRSQFQTDGFVTLKRVNASGNMTEDVTLQSTDATKPNYIAWDTTTDAGKWTYAISNLEYWSPDSTPWKYTITEKNIDASTGYKAVTKTATCTNETKTDEVANVYEGSFADLKNALDGSASVSKAWDDGDTGLGLRPKTISVQLQARFAGEAWTSADDFFAANNWNMTVGANKDLTGKMTNTWGKLPTKGIPAGKDKVAANLQTIEYRVVETNIAATPDHGAVTVNVPAAQTDGASYTDVAADCYTVAGTTATKGNATSTAITNTRDVVSLTVSKTWTDFDNEWGTRPEGGVVTVTIQRKVAGGDWVAVKDADGKDLKVTLTADKSVTVGDLPRTDDTNNEISYRAIEDLDGIKYYVDAYDSYVEAEPPIELSSTDGDGADQDAPAKTYVSANEFAGESSDTPGAEIYEEINNSLKFVNATVPKQFLANNNASTYDPTASGATPTMHVWRKVAGGTWEKVYKADGKTEPTLTWTAVSGQAGRYDVSIDNLPATNGQGQTYTYQIGEDPAWAKAHGFVVTQASEQGNVTKTNEPTTGTIVWSANDPIVNSQTELRIDKFFSADMYSDMSKVSGGTYKIDGTFSDGAKTKSVAVGSDHTAKLASGLLIPGNTYTLTETAAPDGYKKLSGSIKFKVADDGSITQVSSNIGSGKAELANEEFGGNDPKQKTGVVKVTDDPVKVQLTKVLEGSDDKGSDVQFALTPASANGYYLTDAGEKATAAKTVTTDSDGNVIMTGLVVGQKYTLTETVSNHPNAMLGAFTFTVNADGTVNAVTANANWAVASASGVATLTATDPYIGLKIQKLDQDGNAVSTDRRVNGNDKTGMGTWTITPASGSAFSDGSTEAKTLSYHDGIAYLKHGCTYTVVEATAPWGFAVNGETLTVTVSDAGVISIASDKDTSEYAIVTASRKTGDATVATVSLKDKPLTVTLHKTNEDGTINLQGVKWALWGHSLYHPPTGSSITLLGLYSDSNGDSTLGGILLPDVTYGVSEPEPPAGYEWEDERNTISFVLNPDGTVKSYDAGNTSTFVPMTVGGPAVLVQRDKLIEVTLVKKDENGNPIKGSTFTISGRFAAESLNGSLAPADETRTFADTADGSTGSIAIDRLVAGQEYVITETVPPAGYVNASGTADAERFSTTIKVAKDGTVVFDGTPNGQWSLETTGSATSSDHIALKDVKTSLGFVKWGAEAEADGNGQKTGIDGATFTVKGVFAGSDQEQEKTFTTGTDTAMEGFIVGNSYTATETTAPDGYAACANSFTFTVNQDGSINATPTDDWKIATGGKGLIVVDSLNGYGLFKASNDNTLAPNAEFELTGKVRKADGTISAANNKTQVKTTDGIAAMPGLLEGETYTIVETKAPDYHVPDTTPYTFTIKDGVITSTDTNTAWAISDDGKSITMTDVAIRPTLTKTASNNAVVPGAQFTVYKVEDGIETVVGTFTTGSDGKGQLPALLANAEYVVKETITPAGCLTAADCQLEVSTAGVVSIKGTPEHWSISDDGTKLSVEDQLVTATLHKTGDTATAGTKVDLPGAVYEITGKFASTSFVAVEETRTFTTGADGTVALTGLVTGETYTVHEKTPPAGYITGPDFTISVSGNGAVTVTGDGNTAINNVVTTNDIRTNPLMGKSDFEHAKWNDDDDKVIGAGNPIAGGTATFSFKPTGTSTFADGSTDAKTAVVDASKDVSLANSLTNATQLADLGFVVGNTYEVEEIAAPAGYSVSTDKPVVRVKDDGRFEYVDPDDVGFRWVLYDNGVLVSLDSKIQIPFIKASTADGDPISDYCEYQLWPADGSVFADGTTAVRTIKVNDANTRGATIKDLVAGNTYIMKELTAPAGYAFSDSEFKFTVQPNGKIKQVEGVVNWFIESDNGIKAQDRPNNIRVTKLEAQVFGASDHHTLPGVEFTLTDLGTDGNGTNANNPAATTLTAAPNSGDLEFQKLLSGHRYSLVESETVPGFAINGNAVTFSISDTGVFSFDPMPDGWSLDVSTEKPSLSCYDATRVGVKKVDNSADANALEGTVFTVTGDFSDGSTSKTITTNGDGLAELLDAVKISFKENPNYYTIKETTPTPGYLPSTKEVRFYILDKVGLCLEDSTTPITDGDLGDGWAFQDGNFVVVDAPLTYTIEKRSTADDSAVKGAVLSVTGVFTDSTAEQTKTFTTDANGRATVTGIIADNEYTVTETSAPAGFLPAQDSFTFSVDSTNAATTTSDITTPYGYTGTVCEGTDFGCILRDEAVAPAMTVVKSVTSTPANGTKYEVGETITYDIVVTNTGNVPLGDIVVADALTGATGTSALKAPAGTTLQPNLTTHVGDSVTLTTSYTVTEDDAVNKTAIDNTAVATATPADGTLQPVDDTVSSDIVAAHDGISIEKTVKDEKASYALGDTITYTVTVTNTGDIALKNVELTDPLAEEDMPAKFDLERSGVTGDSATFEFTHVVTADDIAAAEGRTDEGKKNVFTNTATVTGESAITSATHDAVTATDDADVTLDAANPVLATTKTVTSNPAMGTSYRLGETIKYMITVENKGNVKITGIAVNDPKGDGETADKTKALAPADLAPGEKGYAYFEHTVTAADIAGAAALGNIFTNMATASGTPVTSATPVTDDDSATAPLDKPAPSLSISKTNDNADKTYALGDVINYTIVVKNTGNVVISDIAVTDDTTGVTPATGETWSGITLAPAESVTLHATKTVTSDDIAAAELRTDAGKKNVFTNTASATGTPAAGALTDVSDSADALLAEAAPSLSIAKTNDNADKTYALGDVISYTITVTNTGNVVISDIAVTDDTTGVTPATGETWSGITLAPAESVTLHATKTVTADDIATADARGDKRHVFTNTASANGTPTAGTLAGVSDTADATLAQPAPALTTVKTASQPAEGKTSFSLGDTITYTVTVTNSGNVDLTGVVAHDPLGTGTPGTDQTIGILAQGASASVTFEHTVIEADILAGATFTNTANATGTYATTDDVTSPDATATSPLDAPAPAMQVTKTITSTPANGSTYSVDEVITYNVTVKNTGNTTLSAIEIADALTGMTDANVAKPADGTTLAPSPDGNGESVTVAVGSYTVTEQDMANGTVTNTANVSAASSDGATPTGNASVVANTTAPNPSIEVVKTITNTPADAAGYEVGEWIEYQVVVTNTGNVQLTNVALADALTGFEWVAAPAENLTLARDGQTGASATFTGRYQVTEADVAARFASDDAVVSNTVTASGTDLTGTKVTDDSTVTAKAHPAHDGISIEKTVKDEKASYALGDTITYTVTVTNTGDLKLTGVTISDPLAEEDMPAAFDLERSGVTGDSATFEFTHVVTAADIAAVANGENDQVTGKFLNTATVTGSSAITGVNDHAAVTATDDADAALDEPAPSLSIAKTNDDADKTYALGETISYTIVVKNTGNVVISDIAVTDDTTGVTPAEGEAWSGITLAPAESITLHATKTVTADDIAAAERRTDVGKKNVFTNTASATGTPAAGTLTDVSDTADALLAEADPVLGIEKVVKNPQASYALGETITYTVTATNTGNVIITNVAISDPLSDEDATQNMGTLNPGDSAEATFAHKVTPADIEAAQNRADAVNVFTNTASVTGETDVEKQPEEKTSSADALLAEAAPAMAIEKVVTSEPADGNEFYQLGETITYEVTVTNTGNVDLRDVVVDDPKGTGETGTSQVIGDLAQGASATVAFEHTVTEDDIHAGTTFTNEATATGASNVEAQPEPVSDTADVTIDTPKPAVEITKDIDNEPANGEAYMSGEKIAYRVHVFNRGNVTLYDVVVKDPLTGSEWTIEKLEPGQDFEFDPVEYEVTEADMIAGTVNDDATVAAHDIYDTVVEDADDAPADVVEPDPKAEIKIEEDTKPGSGDAYYEGEKVAWTVTVTNTGNITLTDVVVECPLTGDRWVIPSLAPGESVDFKTQAHVVTKDDVAKGTIEAVASIISANVAGDDSVKLDLARPDVIAVASDDCKTAVDPATLVDTGDASPAAAGLAVTSAIGAAFVAAGLFLRRRFRIE